MLAHTSTLASRLAIATRAWGDERLRQHGVGRVAVLVDVDRAGDERDRARLRRAGAPAGRASPGRRDGRRAGRRRAASARAPPRPPRASRPPRRRSPRARGSRARACEAPRHPRRRAQWASAPAFRGRDATNDRQCSNLQLWRRTRRRRSGMPRRWASSGRSSRTRSRASTATPPRPIASTTCAPRCRSTGFATRCISRASTPTASRRRPAPRPRTPSSAPPSPRRATPPRKWRRR